MKEKCRDGYGFTNEDKEWVRDMSEGLSAFSNEPHNGSVHHIQGCYTGKLAGTPKETVSDPFQNAIMLTDEQAYEHDREEDYERACLEYEINGHTIYEGKEYRLNEETHYATRGRANTHNQRRRHKVHHKPRHSKNRRHRRR